MIVSLIMLLIMTVLGLSSVRTTSLEEKMSANTYDRSLAFQAAEAGLRIGEGLAKTASENGNIAFPNAGVYVDADENCGTSPCNSDGLCATPDPNCTERWKNPAFTQWRTAAVTLGGLSVTPAYFVEYLGDGFPCDVNNATGSLNCKRYRITARSVAAGRASVMLQSIYATN
ncbi:MAG: PilX N-terminal domain-containing pilus assembly protein [Pseudomonadota bacterium]